MVCDKVVFERWCVTKLCLKDGVCDKVVFERWCVTKLCVTKRAEGGEVDGIQNQKQEPHTKMWRKSA